MKLQGDSNETMAYYGSKIGKLARNMIGHASQLVAMLYTYVRNYTCPLAHQSLEQSAVCALSHRRISMSMVKHA